MKTSITTQSGNTRYFRVADDTGPGFLEIRIPDGDPKEATAAAIKGVAQTTIQMAARIKRYEEGFAQHFGEKLDNLGTMVPAAHRDTATAVVAAWVGAIMLCYTHAKDRTMVQRCAREAGLMPLRPADRAALLSSIGEERTAAFEAVIDESVE